MCDTKTILRLGVLCAAALESACAGSPLFTLSSNQQTSVCPDREIQYCERISAFVWGKCDCVNTAR